MAHSLAEAHDLIACGRVTVGGAPALKAGRQVSDAEPILVVAPAPEYVGRGGLKLAGALAEFDIDVAGRRALDAGSSTGGFTDCLLQAGANSVLAVDVGRNQLHESLRADQRVTSLERTDIRNLAGHPNIEARFDVVVADLSFISTTSLLVDLARLLDAQGDLVILLKPQFEATHLEVSRGQGIISDPTVWKRVLHELIHAAVDAALMVEGLAISPITGAKGNVEFLAHLKHGDILG